MKQLELLVAAVKRCRRCGIEKPRVEFNKHHLTRDKLNSYCRPCDAEYKKEYRAANREKLKAIGREYYLANVARLLAYGKDRYKQKTETIKAAVRAYRKANWGRILPKLRAARHRWSDDKKQRRRAQTKAWFKKNPELRRGYVLARRAKQLEATVDLQPGDIKDILTGADGVCSYCLGKFEKLTIDHVIPLSKGGAHSFDNVVAACMSCNQKKNAHGVLYMLNR